jgi:hypothetical protein
VEDGPVDARRHEREGVDQQVVALVAGEAADGEDDLAVEAEALADGVALTGKNRLSS